MYYFHTLVLLYISAYHSNINGASSAQNSVILSKFTHCRAAKASVHHLFSQIIRKTHFPTRKHDSHMHKNMLWTY